MVGPVFVIGAGGHAKVLIDALELMGRKIIGLADANTKLHGIQILGYQVLGTDDFIKNFDPKEFTIANGIGSIGATEGRRVAYERLSASGFDFATIIHPTATLSRYAEAGQGVQFLAGSIVQAGTLIGANSIINTGAIIEHDCNIGAHCHIAPGATLSGGVMIGDGVHVGAGATVRQGLVIGSGAIIGVGAAVVEDVESGAVVKGVPAR